MKKYRKNSSKANTYTENFERFLKKLSITPNVDKLKAIFLHLEIDNLKKNDPLIS